MDIYFDPPVVKNTFDNDQELQRILQKIIPSKYFQQIEVHLKECGHLASTKWLKLSKEAEEQPPSIINGDVSVSGAWKQLEAEAAIHGIVACAYERKFAEFTRVYQFALLYLFHSSSAFVSCPLAMTDGAARAIELYGDEELKVNAFKHLTSRDPKNFWTSGQWMTERTGGSDVSGTSTIAKLNGGSWTLSGTKWFTSATSSQMAMLLARPEGAAEGSRGLSLFYTELRNSQGQLNNIELIRLKPKLGTKALPTAELELKGTTAKLVGEEGGGVRKISSLFNITRIYNSVCATSQMRRALDLAWDFSRKRSAFGKKLIDQPLHRHTLNQLETEARKCLHLCSFVSFLLGKDECGTATADERLLLRALTPIVKLYTAKVCMRVVSEVVESFGGAGYIEDTGIPKLLRDAQVFSIWEGTTNVLSLDLLRAIEKENVLPPLVKLLKQQNVSKHLHEKFDQLINTLKASNRDHAEIISRDLALLTGEILGSSLFS